MAAFSLWNAVWTKASIELGSGREDHGHGARYALQARRLVQSWPLGAGRALGSLQAELAANGVDQGRGSNEFHYFCHLLEKLTMWQQLVKAIRGSGANSVLALRHQDGC